MTIKASIEHKLTDGLLPHHLAVINESDNHNVPKGSESHFKVVVVSDAFNGKTLVARHQLVYGLLSNELRNGVHALALHTFTSDDWSQTAEAGLQSPPCLGGSKSIQP